jgi:bifunctional non-homologous end joining protein LigD
MGLKDYESKRKFEKTPEPRPGPGDKDKDLVFVVHKHAARSLHYDLRLELDGVLKSWAVPKGPSMNPSLKRLAVMVEDHPIEYKDFEGVIPEHNYGAGSVIIWDKGIYHHPAARNGEESVELLRDGLENGNLKFVLHGEKLQGEFALVKVRRDDKAWLLLKKKDQYATTEDILNDRASVVSHRTLEDISRASIKVASRKKQINRIRLVETLESGDLKDAPLKPMPHHVKPMLATLVKDPFDDPDWLFEVKWDGYRAIAEVMHTNIALYSRNLISFNWRFSPIVDSLRKFRFDALLDGEIVVVDDLGQPDFQMLQSYQKSRKAHLIYYVFDLLHCEGRDLTSLPLVRRKELLQRILPFVPKIKFSDHVWSEGTLFFKVVREKGLEGIIAKNAQSAYQMGRRGRQWLKVKAQLTQEGVIAGFTQPRGTRKGFGTLVLGVFEGNELIFIGHAGGGFTVKTLKEIREKLDPLIQQQSPFRIEPETNAPVTWVKPELVCEVSFRGWTDENVMRQPIFLRLREDKSAHEVVREHPDGR